MTSEETETKMRVAADYSEDEEGTDHSHAYVRLKSLLQVMHILALFKTSI
jgi:hypothetical protein